MGVMPELATMLPDFGIAKTELVEHALQREKELEKEGKSRLDYYTGGEFQKDARAIGSRYNLNTIQSDLRNEVTNLQPGAELDVGGQKFRYNGGDPLEQDAEGNFVNFDLIQ